MSIYQGFPGGRVTVNGDTLNPRNDIVNHSPDGFAWGYSGSGPAQLALAIMVHEFGTDLNKHPCHYQDLKWGLIAILAPNKAFKYESGQIRNWIHNKIKRA